MKKKFKKQPYAQLYHIYANNVIIITYQTRYFTTISGSFQLSAKIRSNFPILPNYITFPALPEKCTIAYHIFMFCAHDVR